MEHHSNSSTHYLMWKLQTKFPPPTYNSSMNKYFQESLVWPPRSYRCSFCRREFRSAQALGGHMNVHRRDRARLKQQSPPPPPILQQHPQLQPDHRRSFNFAAAKNSSTHPHQIILTPPPPNDEVRQFISSIRRSNDDECDDSDDEDDFVESNVVGKRHKLMCSTHQEIDLELRLGQIS